MKKFLLKSAVLLVCVIVLIIGMLPLMPENPNHYMSAQRAKIARLDTLASPRVVIVGGSNAAFGFDCGRIERELGVNVANTALQASVGMKFMVREAVAHARPGDIILLLPEYPQFQSYETYRGTPDLLASAVAYSGAEAWRRLDPMQVAMVIGGLPKHYLGVIKARPQSSWSYNGRNFNVQGDESAHWEITPPVVENMLICRLIMSVFALLMI